MKTQDAFWIFGHIGLGDHIVMNALYRHYASLHKDKILIIPIWEHNLAAVQWMLSDVPNIFFYPIETEQQLLTCRDSLGSNKLCLGFYADKTIEIHEDPYAISMPKLDFNPVKWDSEFYRQAGLDPELKWSGFKLAKKLNHEPSKFNRETLTVVHEDIERGFFIRHQNHWKYPHYIKKDDGIERNAGYLNAAEEIHCIDSSMLNLADLMETPYCKRFVFHRYARKGLPPILKKNWEIVE